MLRIGTVVVGAEQVDRAAAFWAAVLDHDIVTFPDGGDGFTLVVPPDRIGTRIGIHRSAVPVQPEPRVHLDLVVDSAAEQRTEVERLVGLGAELVAWDYPPDPDFVVLADTEGNRFCIVDAGHG